MTKTDNVDLKITIPKYTYDFLIKQLNEALRPGETSVKEMETLLSVFIKSHPRILMGALLEDFLKDQAKNK